MIELDGILLACNIPIREDDTVQEDPFDRHPVEEDLFGCTGNEGTSAQHFYFDTVRRLLFWAFLLN